MKTIDTERELNKKLNISSNDIITEDDLNQFFTLSSNVFQSVGVSFMDRASNYLDVAERVNRLCEDCVGKYGAESIGNLGIIVASAAEDLKRSNISEPERLNIYSIMFKAVAEISQIENRQKAEKESFLSKIFGLILILVGVFLSVFGLNSSNKKS